MFTNRQAHSRHRPGLECLEDRTTPAQFNIPWSDPSHLTLSFVPDGTSALGISSNLNSTLDARMSREAWQSAILRAMQAWSTVSGINVGLVADSGDPFNTPGAGQGDARFGDIRVGAVPMMGVYAEASPSDPFLSGTLAGDILFNSSIPWTPELLYGIALHETGHALGLAPSRDPKSVMFQTFNRNLTLSLSDVTAVRAMYGTRVPDANEGSKTNNTLAKATRLRFSEAEEFDDGELPAVGFGDITLRTDVDYFEFRVPSDYRGPATFRLQTAGVSLLSPRLSVLNSKAKVIAQAFSVAPEGSTLTLTIPQVVAGSRYYVQVNAAPGATFAVGRYGLAVTLDDELTSTVLPIETLLRGPYEILDSEDLGAILTNPEGLINDDVGTNEDQREATRLTAGAGPIGGLRYVTPGSIAATTDIDFYQLKAPAATKGTTFVLTIDLRAAAINGVVPQVELFDSFMNPIPTQVLANGNGRYSIQATGVAQKAGYVARVTGNAVGNYIFEARYGKIAARLLTFSSAATTGPSELNSKLYLAEPQAFGLLLAAEGDSGASVRVTITDSANRVVFDLTSQAGQTVSGTSMLLAPGEYRLQATILGGALTFRLFGDILGDPIGPQPGDTTIAPMYVAPPSITPPNIKAVYLYPQMPTYSIDPYMWMVWIPI